MAKLRVEDLGNTEFQISTSPPPLIQGEQLKTALGTMRAVKVFVAYDEAIDGPQTAARLIKETMSSYRCSFVSQISDADIAVWIGGTGELVFGFVVLDANDYSRYRSYLCGPRILTGAIMTVIIEFVGV